MPTFEQAITDNRVIINVAVGRGGAGDQTLLFAALLDTGAQVTAISPRVVEALDLVPVGQRTLTVASGQAIATFEYPARVDVAIDYPVTDPPEGKSRFLAGYQLFVAGLPYQPDGYDVILGMDVIGGFHLTIYGNRIILSN